ncbi:MAG: dihydroneopterin aldolase [Victivallales bacterium]|nr:dihydroneopterin aldolase [Victivallales bacterium]
MDTITIANLRCSAHIGCEETERVNAQTLFVTATVALDTRDAARTDDLEQTVNYSQLSKKLMRICEESTCRLLETLAQHLADACLAAASRISSATIEIQKPAGVKHADYASIRITRNVD